MQVRLAMLKEAREGRSLLHCGPLFIFALLWGLVGASAAEAVVFQLDVGLTGQSGERLEVARDDAFQELLVQSRIGQQTSYLVNIEKTGRYVYRILRDGKELLRETFFVALEPPPADRLYRASWKAVAGDASYRLSFSRPDGQRSWVVSSSPLVYLGGRGVPWLLRVRAVVPGKAQTESVEQLQVQATVPPPSVQVAEPSKPKSQSQPTPSPAAEVRELRIDPFAQDDDQLSAEPEYKDLLRGEDKRWWTESQAVGGASATLKPLQRPHNVYAWVRSFSESFKVDRRDRYASPASQGLGGGFGASYFVQPTMRVALDLDTHATKTSYEEGGTEPPREEQKRIRLLAGAGVDVLNMESRRENLSLLIGPVFAYLQLPLKDDEQSVGDIGLEVAPVYFPWLLSSQLRYFKSGSFEGALQWTLPILQFSPAKKLSLRPFAGLYRRHTRASADGVDSTFDESGVRLGLDLGF